MNSMNRGPENEPDRSKNHWLLRLFGRAKKIILGHYKFSIAVVILSGLFLLPTCDADGQGPPTENMPVFVALAEIKKGTMRQVGRYYGSLEAPSRFTVSTQVGGTIEELRVDLGDKIANGQIIARINDESWQNQVQQARQSVKINEAYVEEARANLDLAQSDLNRLSSLNQKKIVTQSDFETAQNKHLQAKYKLTVAENQLNNANTALKNDELMLSYTQVKAQWNSGGEFRYVSERLAEAGDLVTANKPLITVVELDPLTAAIEVIEKDYPKIKPGQEALVFVEAWPQKAFKGHISRIAPVLSDSSRQARIEVSVENPDLLLKPGMFSRVELVFERRDNVTAVPVAALNRRQSGFVVFEADPETKTVKRWVVEEGLSEDGYVEIKNLDIKGPVVVLGQHLLEDGGAYLLAGERLKAESQSADGGWWSRFKGWFAASGTENKPVNREKAKS